MKITLIVSAIVFTLTCNFASNLSACYNMFNVPEGLCEDGLSAIENSESLSDLRRYNDQEKVKNLIAALATDEGKKAFKDKFLQNKLVTTRTQDDVHRIADYALALQHDTLQEELTNSDHDLAKTMYALVSQQYGLSLLLLKLQSADSNLFAAECDDWLTDANKKNAFLAAFQDPQTSIPILTAIVNKMSQDQATKNEEFGKQKMKSFRDASVDPIITTFLYALQKRNGTLPPLTRFGNWISEIFSSNTTTVETANLP